MLPFHFFGPNNRKTQGTFNKTTCFYFSVNSSRACLIPTDTTLSGSSCHSATHTSCFWFDDTSVLCVTAFTLIRVNQDTPPRAHFNLAKRVLLSLPELTMYFRGHAVYIPKPCEHGICTLRCTVNWACVRCVTGTCNAGQMCFKLSDI